MIFLKIVLGKNLGVPFDTNPHFPYICLKQLPDISHLLMIFQKNKDFVGRGRRGVFHIQFTFADLSIYLLQVYQFKILFFKISSNGSV
jgi:hypothetical protein